MTDSGMRDHPASYLDRARHRYNAAVCELDAALRALEETEQASFSPRWARILADKRRRVLDSVIAGGRAPGGARFDELGDFGESGSDEVKGLGKIFPLRTGRRDSVTGLNNVRGDISDRFTKNLGIIHVVIHDAHVSE